MLYPPVCPICGEVVNRDRKAGLCVNCVEKVKNVGSSFCMKCGKELEGLHGEYCYDCGRINHIYDQAAAAFVYSQGIKESIYRFKYKGKREYAEWYGKKMAELLGDRIKIWNPDVIIPVPIHKSRLKARGYNQAELIADSLGKYTGIPVNRRLLVRDKKTVPMKELEGVQRLKNIENAFNICESIVEYNTVLVVDDIYTTGATVDACAAVLRSHGVSKVYCACLCIGAGV